MSRFVRFEPSFRYRRRREARVLAASTFAIGIVGGSLLGFLIWQHRAKWPQFMPRPAAWEGRQPPPPSEFSSTAHYVVDVLRVSDGDTFEARVHLAPGRHLITRVRLRGIDAPEMSARCADELRRAEAARAALRRLLMEREVAIWNIGPDKYGRIVADVGTRRTPDVSGALIRQGLVRRYSGGHRGSWC